MWAVLPLKRFQHAKRRLKDVLTPAQREAFFRAMVEDTLAALSAAEALTGVLVVSVRDPRIAEIAARHGAEWLDEGAERGLSGALTFAAGVLSARRVRGMLVIPGDLPLLTGPDVDALLALHDHDRGVTLAPDAAHDGTNGLALSPADVLGFAYGPGSCAAHCARARAAGIEPRVVDSAAFGLDVDTPANLDALRRSGYRGHARPLLDALPDPLAGPHPATQTVPK